MDYEPITPKEQATNIAQAAGYINRALLMLESVGPQERYDALRRLRDELRKDYAERTQHIIE